MSEITDLLSLLKGYRWVNLTHEVTKDIPVYHTFQPLIEHQVTTIAETGSNNKEYTIGTSHGTHIDAPEHFVTGNRKLEEIPAKERMLPLYVLHYEDEVKQNPDFSITVDHIKAFEAEYGEIEARSFVAFSSGWHKQFDTTAHYENEDAEGVQHTPGWSVPALEFLAHERCVTAIGHETLNTDTGIEAAAAGDLAAQRYWLRQNKYQIENMTALDQVPATGSVIVIGVPHIKTAPAFPCEVFAIIPEKEN